MKRVVLVGAGYAHLFCVGRANDFTRRGHELMLVSPSSTLYSGLASGVLSGFHPETADRIDVEALARRSGAILLPARAERIDLAAKVLHAGNRAIGFDLLSLAIGSEPRPLPGERLDPSRCFAAKPIERLLASGKVLERCFTERRTARVVVAGGGLSGFEVAAGLLGLAARRSGTVELTMLAGAEPLRDLPADARQAAMHGLLRRGASIRTGEHAAAVEHGEAVSENGLRFPFDVFVNATGSIADSLAAEAGLETDGSGRMLVDASLRSPVDARVFGAGDCIGWNGRGLAMSGVHAVRQGPALHRNLLAALEGRRLRPYAPALRHLAIMNLGDGTALAARGRFWWQGRSALLLKEWIDRRFLRLYGGGRDESG